MFSKRCICHKEETLNKTGTLPRGKIRGLDHNSTEIALVIDLEKMKYSIRCEEERLNQHYWWFSLPYSSVDSCFIYLHKQINPQRILFSSITQIDREINVSLFEYEFSKVD